MTGAASFLIWRIIANALIEKRNDMSVKSEPKVKRLE
jgi:hypothetical protein